MTVAQLRLDPSLRRLVAQLQAQLIVDPSRLLHVDQPPLSPPHHVNPAIAVAHPRLAYLLDPLFQGVLPGPTRPIVIARLVEQQDATGPADRYSSVMAHLVDQRSLPGRPRSFRFTMS